MRIGVLASSGGSAFAAAHEILSKRQSPRHEFIGATDRQCGFEEVCRRAGVPVTRIDSADREEISRRAARIFEGADAVLLYFSRVTTPDLFERVPTFNIHPALLPAFAGTMDAVKRAADAGVRFLGGTLHLATASVDGGPIIAQVAMPIEPSADRPRLEKYSFIQKVYLTLVLIELLERGDLHVDKGSVHMRAVAHDDRCNPALRDPVLLAGVRKLQTDEDVLVIR